MADAESQGIGDDELVKIRVDLTGIIDDDWPPSDAEWLWAEPVAADLFRLDNIPVFARGLAYGDIVRAHNAGTHWEFDELTRDGGHSTFRVILKKGKLLESGPSAEFWTLLSALGATYEGYQGGPLLAIDVPATSLAAGLEVLRRGETAGIWEYEDGKISGDTALPFN